SLKRRARDAPSYLGVETPGQAVLPSLRPRSGRGAVRPGGRDDEGDGLLRLSSVLTHELRHAYDVAHAEPLPGVDDRLRQFASWRRMYARQDHFRNALNGRCFDIDGSGKSAEREGKERLFELDAAGQLRYSRYRHRSFWALGWTDRHCRRDHL